MLTCHRVEKQASEVKEKGSAKRRYLVFNGAEEADHDVKITANKCWLRPCEGLTGQLWLLQSHARL